MNDRVLIARNLLLGRFVPFLKPSLSAESIETAQAWSKGQELRDSPDLLLAALRDDLMDDWVVKLVNSGRSAIQVSLESMNLPSGSEVILTSFSCAGVVMPVIQSGLIPVLADVDSDFNLSLKSVLEAQTPATKAVILPHLSGTLSKELADIVEWAAGSDVYVIEDVAQAYGLRSEGQIAGSFGDIGIFSSGLGKPVFGPGGGWAITKHPQIGSALSSKNPEVESTSSVVERLDKFIEMYSRSNSARSRALFREKLLRTARGSESEIMADSAGSHSYDIYGIADVEAYLALQQVSEIDQIISQRRRNAKRWADLLANSGLGSLRLPDTDDSTCSKMLLSFDGNENSALADSQGLKRALWQEGIQVEVSYTPLHYRKPFDEIRRTEMSNTERWWRGAFSVPVRPSLEESAWPRIESAIKRVSGSGIG